MPVTIETAYYVSIDKSPVWKVNADLMREVGEQVFVKIRPYDPQLVRLVCHNVVELPKKERPSLAQCAGFKAIIKLRNDSVFQDRPQTDSVEESLFGMQITPANCAKTKVACRG